MKSSMRVRSLPLAAAFILNLFPGTVPLGIGQTDAPESSSFGYYSGPPIGIPTGVPTPKPFPTENASGGGTQAGQQAPGLSPYGTNFSEYGAIVNGQAQLPPLPPQPTATTICECSCPAQPESSAPVPAPTEKTATPPSSSEDNRSQAGAASPEIYGPPVPPSIAQTQASESTSG